MGIPGISASASMQTANTNNAQVTSDVGGSTYNFGPKTTDDTRAVAVSNAVAYIAGGVILLLGIAALIIFGRKKGG